jgi:hypothetical protein
LQRNDCSGGHKVLLSLDKANQIYPVLTDTVNSFELITHGKLSECSGQLDDAVLSGRSGTSLVGGAEAAGLRQIEVRISLF